MRLRLTVCASIAISLAVSCSLLGDILGLLGFCTVVRDDSSTRSVARTTKSVSAPYVEALSIGSADAFAFSYDFESGHWVTPAQSSGNLEDNNGSAVLMTSALLFRRGYTENGSYNRGNLPGTIDIFFFDNLMHMLKIGDYWYADSDRGIEDQAIRWCDHFYLDADGVEHRFDGFDVVFVNEALLDRKLFIHGPLTFPEGQIDLTTSELALVESIDQQVRALDTLDAKVLIPMRPIAINEGGTVEVSVSLDDIISRVEFDALVNGADNPGKVIWDLGESGAPLDYEIELIP